MPRLYRSLMYAHIIHVESVRDVRALEYHKWKQIEYRIAAAVVGMLSHTRDILPCRTTVSETPCSVSCMAEKKW